MDDNNSFRISNINTASIVSFVTDCGRTELPDMDIPEDIFNPNYRTPAYMKAVKCAYCNRTVFTWNEECPGCGAPNDIYMPLTGKD